MTFVNATALDWFGYTKDDLEAGMSLFQLIAPADRRRARGLFRRSMGGDDVGRVESADGGRTAARTYLDPLCINEARRCCHRAARCHR